MKKYVSIFAVLLLTVMLMTSSSAKTLRRGDVNSDGSITATDARTILRAAATLTTLTDEQKLVADVDGNGKVTAKDARMVLRVSAKLDPDFEPIEIEDPTEPTTEEPTTEEPTTEEPTTEEPTTEKPTTEEPTTEEPTTEEPTTEEPTTEEPTTEEPVADGDQVAYENLPVQIKAFLSGKFGFDGVSYLDGGKTPISMFTDGKNLRTTMTMTSDGTAIAVDALLTEKKSLVGGTKKVVYLVNDEKKKYYDASAIIKADDLNIDFGDYDPSSTTAYVSEKTVGSVTYTIYTIPSGTEKVDLYVLGDEIKCFQIYDSAGNVQTRMDIDKFYAELPEGIFSLDGYKKAILITDVVDMGL